MTEYFVCQQSNKHFFVPHRPFQLFSIRLQKKIINQKCGHISYLEIKLHTTLYISSALDQKLAVSLTLSLAPLKSTKSDCLPISLDSVDTDLIDCVKPSQD